MRYPSIESVASDLYDYGQELASNRAIVLEGDFGDVRLQVCENGDWQVHTGDASYDTDHTGFWGASSVSAGASKRECRDTARDLISQCREDAAQSAE